MKYVRQFWIILLISAMGEALHVLIPLPVPASVYGLVIMLIALGTHIIRLEQVKEAAEFLIEIMPVMFIPAGVGLLTAWGILKPVCVPIILITEADQYEKRGFSGMQAVSEKTCRGGCRPAGEPAVMKTRDCRKGYGCQVDLRADYRKFTG